VFDSLQQIVLLFANMQSSDGPDMYIERYTEDILKMYKRYNNADEYEYKGRIRKTRKSTVNIPTKNKTKDLRPESTSEYQPTNRRLSAKLVPTFCG
jgi:hypothetical protein